MSLDLGNDSNFTPYIRWMASVQAWRENGEDGPQQVEIENVVMDLENIRQGWGFFAEGEAPSWEWDNGSRPPRPSTDHKRGFYFIRRERLVRIRLVANGRRPRPARLRVWKPSTRSSSVSAARTPGNFRLSPTPGRRPCASARATPRSPIFKSWIGLTDPTAW